MAAAPAIPGTHEPGYVAPRLLHDGPATMHLLGAWGAAIEEDAVRHVQCWQLGACHVIVAQERASADHSWLWHLSISHASRHPTWDEIKTARYRLLPEGLCFGMLLPPPGMYVNVPQQDHVFHLWEITDPREPWSAL
jgi:hypothetical protein